MSHVTNIYLSYAFNLVSCLEIFRATLLVFFFADAQKEREREREKGMPWRAGLPQSPSPKKEDGSHMQTMVER